MVAAMVKIYTKKGDDGTTSLWYGGRVPKTNARTEAYGSIDEANSALGVARALCKGDSQADLHATILSLQQDLFVAGAELATSPEAADRLQDGVSRITDGMVEALEVDIDRYMNQVDLPPQFVIPGGTELSAALDVGRSAIRRAERRVVELRDSEGLGSDTVLRYLNRASDLAFALARFADEPNPQMFEGRRAADDK
jgi:cob(I)alamin adenosyltransferase